MVIGYMVRVIDVDYAKGCNSFFFFLLIFIRNLAASFWGNWISHHFLFFSCSFIYVFFFICCCCWTFNRYGKQSLSFIVKHIYLSKKLLGIYVCLCVSYKFWRYLFGRITLKWIEWREASFLDKYHWFII